MINAGFSVCSTKVVKEPWDLLFVAAAPASCFKLRLGTGKGGQGEQLTRGPPQIHVEKRWPDTEGPRACQSLLFTWVGSWGRCPCASDTWTLSIKLNPEQTVLRRASVASAELRGASYDANFFRSQPETRGYSMRHVAGLSTAVHLEYTMCCLCRSLAAIVPPLSCVSERDLDIAARSDYDGAYCFVL